MLEVATVTYDDELLINARLECAELARAIGIQCERRARKCLDELVGNAPAWHHPPSEAAVERAKACVADILCEDLIRSWIAERIFGDDLSGNRGEVFEKIAVQCVKEFAE